jgi:hypothetical protein
MVCHCIKDDNFAFIIDYKSDYIVFTDYSEWLTGKETTFENFEVEIKNIVSCQTKKFLAKPNLSVIIKHKDLPLDHNKSCPPDGIYSFKIKVCQGTQEYEKIEAVLLSAWKSYEKLVKTDSWDDAFEVLKYIEYVRVFANENNIKKASEYYLILQKLLKKLKCTCNGWNLQMYESCN